MTGLPAWSHWLLATELGVSVVELLGHSKSTGLADVALEQRSGAGGTHDRRPAFSTFPPQEQALQALLHQVQILSAKQSGITRHSKQYQDGGV